MKIAILGDASFVPVQTLARFLLARGHTIELLTFGSQDLGPEIPVRSLSDLGRSGLLLGRSRVKRLVEQIRPDVVHAFYLTSYGWLASGLHGTPVLATGMGTDVFGAPDLSPLMKPLRLFLVKRALSRADLLHSVAEHMTRRMIALGADPGRIVTFPRGIDLHLFVPGPACDRGGDETVLLCNRKLEAVYDHQTLLRGARLLAQGNERFHLRIVGGGTLEGGLRALSSALGLADRVEFEPAVPHARMPATLAGAQVFVSASLSDGASSCLFEAMAVGLVPVVSDIPANRPWIQEGENGFLFAPGDPASFADAVRRALAHADCWAEIRRANRARIEASASLEHNLERVIGLYERLIHRP